MVGVLVRLSTQERCLPPAHRGCSAPQTRARGEVDVFHKPRHGFASEPMYVGVGGCQDDRLRCGQRVVCADPHTYSQQAKHDEIDVELEKVQFLPVGIGDSLHALRVEGWYLSSLINYKKWIRFPHPLLD